MTRKKNQLTKESRQGADYWETERETRLHAWQMKMAERYLDAVNYADTGLYDFCDEFDLVPAQLSQWVHTYEEEKAAKTMVNDTKVKKDSKILLYQDKLRRRLDLDGLRNGLVDDFD